MYTRRYQKALTPRDVWKLVKAEQLAKNLGKELDTFVTVHPKFMMDYPLDVGKWLSAFLNKLKIWCHREGFGYFAVWVRENYEGDRHEHVHMLMNVPLSKLLSLKQAVRRWLPGDDRVVDVRPARYRTNPFGRKINEAFEYSLKQMTPQAWRSLRNHGKPVRRETHHPITGRPVAPVLGKKCGVSRSLYKARKRQALWNRPIVFADKSFGDKTFGDKTSRQSGSREAFRTSS